ncbi:zinc finger, CCHC-type, Retrotransposon gag domain protein [Artemisia annua]|uniref:Zinc finger, CCHC-type, Retrotransposon gag domain protein n=1 Tax=Artemisia annua TaxID=35608 RepID=A0A2U1MJN5_ARTAN|nr:zinc finger, CCHC-type, Retrotransposon gag domain protein [Artemisia annua]
MSVNRTPEEAAAFRAEVAQAVETLMPELRTRLFEEFQQNASGSGGGGTPVTISGWLQKFGKEKPRSFSSANTPVDAENWIAHIEKIFEVLDCGDEFKARLASYKLEGDALNWWKAYKQAKDDTFIANMTWADFRGVFYTQYFPLAEQQKFEREYHTIRQGDHETTTEFMKRFLRLAGFLGAKAGTQEEQASHFKWGLKEWILDGIVNTEFTDVAQVANAGRNIELLRERNRENKRNRDGDRIRSAVAPTQNNAPRVQDQRYNDRRNDNRQNYGRDRGQQTNRNTGKQCYKETGACFLCGSLEHRVRDCPKNDGRGDGRQPPNRGRVFALTRDQAATSSVMVIGRV